MRNLLLRFDHARSDAGTHFWHVDDFHVRAAGERAVAWRGNAAYGSGGFGGGGRGGSSRCIAFHVGFDDATAGAGSLDQLEVDALFGGDFAGNRRCFNAVRQVAVIAVLGLGSRGSRRRGGWCGGGCGVLGGLRRLRFGRGGCRSGTAVGGSRFALRADVADDRADPQRLPRLTDQLDDRAASRCRNFNRRLIGFDFGDHVAFFDLLADLFRPVEQDAFFHIRTEVRHLDFLSHYPSTSFTASTTFCELGSAINSISRA